MSATNLNTQKKLILLDLDGTLLNNAGNISKYSIQILKRLNDDGHIICLLTGRTLQSTLKIYKKINLSTICICYNGALIAIPTSKNNFKYVAPTNIKFPYKLFNSLDRLTEIRNIIIHTTKFNYLLRKSTRSDLITWKKMDYIDNKTKICSNTKSIDMTGLLRMLIYLNNKNYTNTISLFNKHKEFNHRIWNINDQIFIEVFPKQYNKYTAITYLRKYYGIKLNDILFFADHFNDISAAKRIPNSFAVKNANSQLKNISKCITKFDNDHDGVARELESIFYANSRIR